MLKPYSEIWRQVISDRVCEVEEQVLLHDEEFLELDKRVDKLQKELQRRLGSNCNREVFELDELSILRDARAFEVMYLQGVKDGVKFVRFKERSLHDVYE